MSEGSVENITASENSFASNLVNYYLLPDVKYNGRCLINNNMFVPRKVINAYISYILDTWSRDSNTDFTLYNCLFGLRILIQNTNPD